MSPSVIVNSRPKFWKTGATAHSFNSCVMKLTGTSTRNLMFCPLGVFYAGLEKAHNQQKSSSATRTATTTLNCQLSRLDSSTLPRALTKQLHKYTHFSHEYPNVASVSGTTSGHHFLYTRLYESKESSHSPYQQTNSLAASSQILNSQTHRTAFLMGSYVICDDAASWYVSTCRSCVQSHILKEDLIFRYLSRCYR